MRKTWKMKFKRDLQNAFKKPIKFVVCIVGAVALLGGIGLLTQSYNDYSALVNQHNSSHVYIANQLQESFNQRVSLLEHDNKKLKLPKAMSRFSGLENLLFDDLEREIYRTKKSSKLLNDVTRTPWGLDSTTIEAKLLTQTFNSHGFENPKFLNFIFGKSEGVVSKSILPNQKMTLVSITPLSEFRAHLNKKTFEAGLSMAVFALIMFLALFLIKLGQFLFFSRKVPKMLPPKPNYSRVNIRSSSFTNTYKKVQSTTRVHADNAGKAFVKSKEPNGQSWSELRSSKQSIRQKVKSLKDLSNI